MLHVRLLPGCNQCPVTYTKEWTVVLYSQYFFVLYFAVAYPDHRLGIVGVLTRKFGLNIALQFHKTRICKHAWIRSYLLALGM